MEQLLAVAKTLRTVHHFGGYIHIKAIPGCSQRLIDETGLYADRLSANIELPTQQDLVQLAPEKKADVIETTMTQIHDRKAEADEDRGRFHHAPRFAPAGQSTQMVIGATPSTDRDIIARASGLYNSYKLRRVYYTGFSPYPEADTRLPLKASPMIREHRLYQADWLMRHYGFSAGEITTADSPDLDLAIDPKLAWAQRHPEFFPVDVNAAPRETLLRVPGLGYRNVDRILSIRRYHRLELDDLRKLHVRLKDAQNYLVTADHLPSATIVAPVTEHERVTVAPTSEQMTLFGDAAKSALWGSL